MKSGDIAINAKEVQSIEIFHPRKQTTWLFFEDRPEVKGRFGRIKEKHRPRGWYTWRNPGWEYSYEAGPFTAEEAIKEDEGRYFINKDVLEEFSIMERPFLKVQLRSGSTLGERYDTVEEARKVADEIIKIGELKMQWFERK